MHNIEIIETTFIPIHEMWSQWLWPGRQDIKYMSSMTYPEQEYDMQIYQLYKPTFLAAYTRSETGDLEMVGCNTGHRSATRKYRSRGLFVKPEYRGQGIAQRLLKQTLIQARLEHCNLCWTMPRKTSLPSYIAAGFKQTSDFFGTENNDANCYAVAEL